MLLIFFNLSNKAKDFMIERALAKNEDNAG